MTPASPSLIFVIYIFYIQDQEEIENTKVDDKCNEVEVNSYVIRRGKEEDVLRENIRKSDKNTHSVEKERFSDYTYDDFLNEFEREKSAEELYQADCRLPADCEITDCHTLQACRQPDKQFVLVNMIYNCSCGDSLLIMT